MGLSKLAIISIATGSVIGIGAITATAVVVSQNQNTINQKANSVAWTKLNPATTIQQKLENFLKTIQATDLVLTKKKSSETQIAQPTKKSLVEENIQALKVNDVYAFNASEYEFGLDDSIKLPEKTELSIAVDKASSNNLEDLNEGKLNLKLDLTNKDANVYSTLNLAIDSFKKPSETIKKLVDNSTLNILCDNKEGIKEFVTLEQLNKQNLTLENKVAKDINVATYSGLSVLLNEVNKQENQQQKVTLSIEGKVKLDRISKEEKDSQQNIYFYLTSADETFLKLTRKEQDAKQEEILVKEIKLNNLAVSSISIVPIQNKQETSNKYSEELKTIWKEGKEKTEELSVSIPKQTTGDNDSSITINLPINAYKLEKDQKPESNIEAYLLVSFGSGNNIKTYDTSKPEELKVLTEAGISFGIFSKDISKPSMPKAPEVHSGIVSEANNKLETYFTKTSNKNPLTKPTEKEGDMKQEGEYFLNRLIKSVGADKFQLGINASNKPEKAALLQPESSKNQNWLVFANYSYPNMNKKSENNKVLIAPSLSLIHIEIKPDVQ